VKRRPGFGGRRISIRNQDEQLLTVIRNSPFTSATAAVNISNFPGSVKTSRRRLRSTELRNHAAARLCSQTKRSSSRRTMVVLGCIDHETADMMNATLNRPNDSVAFLLTYGGGFLLLVLG
jgi:hypothetical protein